MNCLVKKIFVLISLSVFLLPLSAKELDKTQKKAVKKAAKMKVVEVVEDEGAFQAKKVVFSLGKMKYLLKGALGTYQLYVLDEKKNPVPVFSTQDEFSSTFFDLKIDNRVYRLNDSSVTVTGARRGDLGGQMVFSVPKKARVFTKYEKMAAPANLKGEVIKVTSTILNRSTKTQTFALKNVMDTVLGEKDGSHFSTAVEENLKKERCFRKLDEAKWLLSSDGETSVQFLLYGADVTPPEMVIVSNKDFLSLPSWTPQVGGDRNFDSVLSYNNSALCIMWKDVVLEPGQIATFVYYMAINSDGEKCMGEQFISWYENKLNNKEVEEKYSVKEFEDLFQEALAKYEAEEYKEAYDIVMKLWENPDNQNERLKELKELIEKKLNPSEEDLLKEAFSENDYDYEEDMPPSGLPEPEEAPVPEEVPEVNFDLNSISAEQMNPEYVQGLINRINALEENDDSIDRNEILKLHAELDAILEKLRHE
ncbi:MAG: hypothetical protein K6F15_07920 [Treponema sp.]|nr:hypothetical protein [Treponema sp.]